MAAPSASHEVLEDLLRQGGLFESLGPGDLDQLASRMRAVRYPVRSVICEEGDPGAWTFIVGAGEIAVLKKAKDGATIQVTTLRRGDWGGMMSLFERAPRSAKLVARTDAELWRLDHDALEVLLRTVPGLATGLLGFMSRRLRMDAVHLAATLRYVSAGGLEDIYEQCSPEERLILDTINHRVAASESLDEIMSFLFDAIRQIGDCDRMTLAFVEEEDDRIVAHWTRTTRPELRLRNGYAEDLHRSSLAEVLESGRPRVIDDLEQHLRDHPDSRATRLITGEGLRSSMTCPLIVGGRPIGLMFRNSCRRGAFDDHQVRLHQAIAETLSFAVERAYRFEQLTKANRAYGEVLGFVAHELKSPIASIVTDAAIMRKGLVGAVTDRQGETIDRITRQGGRLLKLIDDYLNLDRLESGRLECRPVPDVDLVGDVVEPTIEMSDVLTPERGIAIERAYPEETVRIECDPGLLRIAVSNLLDNAVKYGVRQGRIRIRVGTTGRQAQIVVWNEGPGFPEEAAPHLFRKFSRLDVPELKKKKGTGVGLYSTWRIVRLHRGHIRARSEVGAWAEFTITLPQDRDADVDGGEGRHLTHA